MSTPYQKLVDEQAAVMGVQPLPVVTENEGSAATDMSHLFINPSFASELHQSSGEAGLRFVVAHELGHARGGAGGGHEGELSADRWAAHSLVHAGLGPEAIDGVMAKLDSTPTESHPGPAQRQSHARAAWAAAFDAKALARTSDVDRGRDR